MAVAAMLVVVVLKYCMAGLTVVFFSFRFKTNTLCNNHI